MDTVTFWGTGDSMGVPRVYCSCEVCEEARSGGLNRRYRSSVLFQAGGEDWLIDCGPDWVKQMERAGRRRMERVLITHAHFDHVGGLPEWADACRWLGERGEVYAPAEVITAVRRQFPWLEAHLLYREVDQGLTVGGWRVEAHQVCHGKNGFSYAYRFLQDGCSWAYCPDAINLSAEEKAFLTGADLLVQGTNFYQEDAGMETRSVYDMVEAFALMDELRPGRAIFTHMSHGVDLRTAYPLPANVELARSGMTVTLQK
jgi:phosphoribosyl 1,2-cyclic phosphate phosphodiesterase